MIKKQRRPNSMNEKTPKKIIKTQKDIEKLIVLMKKHKVDLLEIEGHKLVISRHDSDPINQRDQSTDSDTELEFWNLRPQ